MCGIAGLINFDGKLLFEEKELVAFSDSLKFRGPDATGYLSDIKDGVALQFTHRRLSIIDLSEGGNQPMLSNTGNSVIIFNGEIYNYKTLKNQLQQEGAIFRTGSDTEVLLNGFEYWGIEKLLDKCDGMFAFALYSYNSRELFLARDRFGKKPLYYFYDGQKAVFGSDIRIFDSIREIPKNLNLNALGYYFAELSVPDPESIWLDIKKIPASHYLCISQGKDLLTRPYWKLKMSSDCNLSKEEIVEKTDYLLNEAIKKRLVADVNVAAQLSGGIDSSLICAKMALMSVKPISTYSVGFDDESFNELPYARMVADRYKTKHHEMIMQPQDISETQKLILEYGEPFADVSMIPSFMISKFIAQNEKVVIGGDGGDELFAGYYIYYFAEKLAKVKGFSWASPLVNIIAKIAPTYRVRFLKRLLKAAKNESWQLLNRKMGFDRNELNQIFGNNAEISDAYLNHHRQIWDKYADKDFSDLKILLRASIDTRLLNDYLVKVDRASMFASLEMRSPFLDRHLAEFAFSLNEQQLFSPSGTKSILKQLAEKYLPKELIYRNKMGFAVPIGNWFRKELKAEFKSLVFGNKQQMIEMNYPYLEKLFERHCAGEDHTHKLWALYVFHYWASNRTFTPR
jgi:asparagine synthase (glutamine-hydrolysing)